MTKINSTAGRTGLMITAGSAMAATMMATGAQAAQTDVTVGGAPAAAVAHDPIDAVLSNVGEILAQVDAAIAGIDHTVTPTTNTSVGVANNDILATALGNSFDSHIDLSVIANDGLGDGAAALGFAYNDAHIGSAITNSSISIDLADFISGSVSTVDNTIAAHSIANNGITLLDGPLPNTYISTELGSSALDFPGATDWLNASGSLVVSTLQINNDPATTSLVSADTIALDLISTDTNIVSASPELDRNTISGAAEGNSSNSLIDVQSGGSPNFAGSAVLTNSQLNYGTTGGTEIIAENINSLIFSTIDADTNVNTLAGSLTVDDNKVSSSATGNSAVGSAPGQVGNSIVLGDGVSFTPSGAPAASAEIDYTGLGLTALVTADVVINSSQANLGPSNNGRLSIEATTDNATVGADVQAIDAGSISVSNNDATSLARGNAASSLFDTGAGSAFFNGAVAVVNQQTDTYADVTATTTVSDIGVDVAFAGIAQLANSSVAVDGNTSSASAYGNQINQAANVTATSFAGMPENNARLRGGTGPVDGFIDTLGNVTVSSLQSIYSSDVIAREDSSLYLDTHALTVLASGLEATGNVQEAIVVGNGGTNSLVAKSTTNAVGMGVTSIQIVADDSTISADTNSEAQITSEFSIDASTLDLTNNLQRAIAYGGSVSNTLDITTQALSSTTTGMSSTVIFDQGATDGFVLDNTTPPVVDSANGLLNVQSVSADISATSSAPQAFAVEVTGDATNGSSIVNDGNALVGAAYGSNALNVASLKVGDVTSGDNNYEDILALANVQTVAGDDTSIQAEASGGSVVNTLVTGLLTDS